MKRLLTATVCAAGLIFLGSIVFAVLAEVQSDYLGALSEATGGFDPTVFPPFETLTWLMAMSAPFVAGPLLALSVIARVATRIPHA